MHRLVPRQCGDEAHPTTHTQQARHTGTRMELIRLWAMGGSGSLRGPAQTRSLAPGCLQLPDAESQAQSPLSLCFRCKHPASCMRLPGPARSPLVPGESSGGSMGLPWASWTHGWLVVLNVSIKGAICVVPMPAVKDSSTVPWSPALRLTAVCTPGLTCRVELFLASPRDLVRHVMSRGPAPAP